MVNINISNGTCYWAPHTEAQEGFIPCGNTALGTWPCCRTGDVCLGFGTANACYDYNTSNSYIAGCTDESYVDKLCPQKSSTFEDQEWVGIQHCGTNSNGNTNWGGCRNDPVNLTTLVKLANDQCDPYCASATLWVGPSSINAYATVPTTAGGTITWTSNFNPLSTTSSATAGGDGGAAASTATTTSGSDSSQSSGDTNSKSSGNSNSSGLDTGAKIGIGVGISGAAILAVIAGLLLWLVVRRRRSRDSEQGKAPDAPPPPHPQSDQKNTHSPSFSPYGPRQSALSDAPPYYTAAANTDVVSPSSSSSYYHHMAAGGFKAELPADGQSLASASPNPGSLASPAVGAAAADTHPGCAARSVSVASMRGQQQQQQQQQQNLGGGGGLYVSPQSTGATTATGGQYGGHEQQQRQQQQGPYYEM